MAVDEKIKSVQDCPQPSESPKINGGLDVVFPKVLEIPTELLMSKEHKLPHSRPPEKYEVIDTSRQNLNYNSYDSKLMQSNPTCKNNNSTEQSTDLCSHNSANQLLSNGNCLNKEFQCNTSNNDSDALSLNTVQTENKPTTFYIGDDSCQSPRDYFQNGKYFSFKKRARRVTISEVPTGEMKQKEILPPTFTPPDGGYGWVIAFSAFFVNTFIIGFLKSYGVLYMSITEKFPDASAYQISWVQVFLGTFGLVIAPITGYLCRRFTSRKVAFFGGLLIFLGILMGAYATTITQLICTFGLLTGIGYGLTSTPGILIVSLYFEKRRGLASAICVSGNAVGSFLFPPLLEYLLSNYGLEGTMLITAALQLNICAMALLFRPIRDHALIQEKNRRRMTGINENQDPLLTRDCSYFLKKSDSMDQIIRRKTTFFSRFNLGEKKGILTESSEFELDELHRQVSFIRSSSMLNSIPDLSHYARSWNISNNPPLSLSRQSSTKLSLKNSKASLSNLASMINSRSQLDLIKGSVKWIPASERLRIRKKDSTISMPGLTSGVQQQSNRMSCKRTKEPTLMTPLAESDSGLSCDSEKNEMEEETITKSSTSPKLVNETCGLSKLQADSEVRSEQKVDKDEQDVQSKVNCCSVIQTFFDFSLLKNSTFLIVNASMFLYMAGTPHTLFYLPAFATSIGIERSRVVSLLSISSIVDLIGRLSIGFLADMNLVSCDTIYIISTLLGAASVILIPNCSTYTQLAVMLGIYGFGIGSWFVMIPTLLIKNHGPSMLASSFGLVRMFHGLMSFMSPQIMGILLDATNSYETLYYYMGICMALSCLIILLQSITSCIVDSKNSTLNVDIEAKINEK